MHSHLGPIWLQLFGLRYMYIRSMAPHDISFSLSLCQPSLARLLDDLSVRLYYLSRGRLLHVVRS